MLAEKEDGTEMGPSAAQWCPARLELSLMSAWPCVGGLHGHDAQPIQVGPRGPTLQWGLLLIKLGLLPIKPSPWLSLELFGQS